MKDELKNNALSDDALNEASGGLDSPGMPAEPKDAYCEICNDIRKFMPVMEMDGGNFHGRFHGKYECSRCGYRTRIRP